MKPLVPGDLRPRCAALVATLPAEERVVHVHVAARRAVLPGLSGFGKGVLYVKDSVLAAC